MLQIVDAIVISVSFVFDIIFLSDIYSNENEKAAAFVVIMLMWRIARITDSKRLTHCDVYIRLITITYLLEGGGSFKRLT